MDFFKLNWKWILLVLFILFILIRTKIRGYFWKVRKTKQKLKFKEFFGLWRKGIEGITPLQIARTSLWGTWIIITGIISGIVVNVLVRLEHQWWWITIILFGSLIVTTLTLIGSLQKYWRLKRIDREIKRLEDF
jgi:hypothetical protein